MGYDCSLEPVFEKIHYKILLRERQLHKKIKLWSIFGKVAAILLIPLTTFLMWNYILKPPSVQQSVHQSITTGWVEINAPVNSKVEFLLPDSTKGWLNSGSKLKYPLLFEQVREVKLLGEAYFEVKSIPNSVFNVNLTDLNVKVLGTKFNVIAYNDELFTDVVLAEGKVEIEGKSSQFNQVLVPNQLIRFNRNLKSYNVLNVNANNYTAWKEGFLIIDNEPLVEAVARIERRYNAKFIIKDEILKNYRFKATFKDESLEEVLKLIALTTPMKYKIERYTEINNGETKITKVILELK
jgi:ferric-dicitrate binding protein FerR (iron transport regulator)